MTKPTKWYVRQVKTQISLGICPVRSESSLCAQCLAKGPMFLHAVSELWSDWADAQADLSLHRAQMSCCCFCHASAQINCGPSEATNQPVYTSNCCLIKAFDFLKMKLSVLGWQKLRSDCSTAQTVFCFIQNPMSLTCTSFQAEQAGLSLTWWHNSLDRLSHDMTQTHRAFQNRGPKGLRKSKSPNLLQIL